MAAQPSSISKRHYTIFSIFFFKDSDTPGLVLSYSKEALPIFAITLEGTLVASIAQSSTLEADGEGVKAFSLPSPSSNSLSFWGD